LGICAIAQLANKSLLISNTGKRETQKNQLILRVLEMEKEEILPFSIEVD